MVTYHGSCLCGDIAYEVTGDPVLKATCHCKSCQKETGSAFASDIVFPSGSIKFTKGQTKTFNERGSSGKYVRHNFCPNCGSSVYGVLEVLDSVEVIRVGGLDDYPGYTPEHELYTKSKLSWVPQVSGAAQHETMPS